MNQKIIDIEKVDLLNKVLNMKSAGYRLGQMCALKQEKFVLLYTFIKNGELVTLRFTCESGEPVESISWLYSYAFLYENEMKDLFGITMSNMSLDFNGHFFTTAVKTPYNAAGEADSDKNGMKNNG